MEKVTVLSFKPSGGGLGGVVGEILTKVSLVTAPAGIFTITLPSWVETIPPVGVIVPSPGSRGVVGVGVTLGVGVTSGVGVGVGVGVTVGVGVGVGMAVTYSHHMDSELPASNTSLVAAMTPLTKNNTCCPT